MQNSALCKKISSMLSLYIDNKVNYQERALIEDHLANCEECRKKYLYLKSLIKNLKDSYKQVVELALKKQKNASFSIREHEKFIENLSPYIDNELDAQECFEFRKYLMKSKTAQRELKSMYVMQKEMRRAYDIAKKGVTPSFSRSIVNRLKEKQPVWYESEIIKNIFTAKTAKVAILTGLIFFGAYEVRELNKPIKPQRQRVLLKEEAIKPVNMPSFTTEEKAKKLIGKTKAH